MLSVEILPITLFLLKFRLIKKYFSIFLYVLSSFIFEITSYAFFINGIDNQLIFNLYGLSELFCLIYFFFSFFPDKKKIITVLSFIFLTTYFYNFSMSAEMDISITIGSTIWIILSLICLFTILKNSLKDNLVYFFTIAILIYNSGSIFLFSIKSLLINLDIYLWLLHNFYNALSLLIISFAIWKLPTNDFFKSEPPKV